MIIRGISEQGRGMTVDPGGRVAAETVHSLGFAKEEVDGMGRVDAGVQDRAAGLGRVEQAMIGRGIERKTKVR